MLRFNVIAFCALSLTAALISPALAIPDNERDAGYEASIDSLAASLRDLRVELSTEEQTVPRLEEYLSNALWLVYTAKVYADSRWDDTISVTNGDLTKLVDLGYLPFWPANPLNNWEPMAVGTPADRYSAGDLCLAVCPPSHASFTPVGIMPVSFDLFVYAPVQGLEEFGQFKQAGENKDWSTPPLGALYGLSYYVQSEAKYQATLKHWREHNPPQDNSAAADSSASQE